jgi:hypothetical protein
LIYQYNKKVTDCRYEMRLIASNTLRSHYEVTFPSPLPTEWEESKTVYGDYFVPSNMGKVPLINLVHGYGDKSIAPCLAVARLLGTNMDRITGSSSLFATVVLFQKNTQPKHYANRILTKLASNNIGFASLIEIRGKLC